MPPFLSKANSSYALLVKHLDPAVVQNEQEAADSCLPLLRVLLVGLAPELGCVQCSQDFAMPLQTSQSIAVREGLLTSSAVFEDKFVWFACRTIDRNVLVVLRNLSRRFPNRRVPVLCQLSIGLHTGFLTWCLPLCLDLLASSRGARRQA